MTLGTKTYFAVEQKFNDFKKC